MAVLSKIARDFGLKTLDTNCYETVHPWNPNCWFALLEGFPGTFFFCLKTFSMFYLATNLFQNKDPRRIKWKKFLVDTLRSSLYLSSYVFFYFLFFCRIRHLLGFYIVFTTGGLNSFLASFLSFLIEKKSRRPTIALWFLNLASEAVYRQFLNRGYMFRVKFGECLPFACGLCLLKYLHSKERLQNSLVNVLKFTHNIEPPKEIIRGNLPSAFYDFLSKLRAKYGKSIECGHHNSCISVAIETFLKNFGIGLGVSTVLTLLKNLKSPKSLLKAFVNRKLLKLPFFFAFMPFLFHTTKCVLNRHSSFSSETKDVLAIGVSSIAMTVNPSVNIAMFTLWKGIESFYFYLVDQKKLPYFRNGDHFLYTLAAGYVVWMATIEPHALRKGFLNILMGLTRGRLALLNRKLLDEWGYESSKMFDYNPVLDARYATRNPMFYQPIEHP